MAAVQLRYDGNLSGKSTPPKLSSDASQTLLIEWTESGFRWAAPFVEARFTQLDSTLSLQVAIDDPARGLNNALRVWTSVTLPTERDGLMLHAASCIYENQGVVIAGVSGAGKSTFANGLQEATYLTDDITLVDRLSTEPRLLATPFHGSLGRVGADEESELSVVGILSQFPAETRIRRLRPAEAATSLLRHVVAFSSDKRLTGPILDRVASLVANVPVFDIARSLDDSSDEVCRKLLAAAKADA